MKPTTIILSLVAAALAGVSVVCVVSENDAVAALKQAQDEAREAIRVARAKQTAAERAAAESEVKAKSADKAAEAALAKVSAANDAHKKTDEDYATAKSDLAKNSTKIAELEKARSEAAARVNELNAEIAKLRDGTDVREALAKAKKADADAAQASGALRDATAKLDDAAKKLAVLEEENARLKAEAKGFDNPSPNYRSR